MITSKYQVPSVRPTADAGRISFMPFLMWNVDASSGPDEVPLACPQCGCPSVNWEWIGLAASSNEYQAHTYLAVDPHNGTVSDGSDLEALHGGKNRGSMFVLDYWCFDQCQGRIELRNHKGRLLASLHNQPWRGSPAYPDADPAM